MSVMSAEINEVVMMEFGEEVMVIAKCVKHLSRIDQKSCYRVLRYLQQRFVIDPSHVPPPDKDGDE